MTTLKNKKMATLGLYMILIGGLISIIGGFMYNRYKDKSGAEKHEEILSNHKDLAEHINSSTGKILSILDTNKAKNEENLIYDNSKSKAVKKTKDENKMEEKKSTNSIINYAPNQGIQINENKGTVVFGNKQVIRTFSAEDARKILSGYPKDFPIEIWLKGTKKESMQYFEQVVNQVKASGYTNISTNIVGMYVGENHDSDFTYGIENGKLVFSIYPQE